MDPHERGGAHADGRGIVPQIGAVRGAHLDQQRAALGHHLGDAEASADLHKLASRDDHLAPLGQHREGQEHCTRVVIDQKCGLGAGQPA